MATDTVKTQPFNIEQTIKNGVDLKRLKKDFKNSVASNNRKNIIKNLAIIEYCLKNIDAAINDLDYLPTEAIKDLASEYEDSLKYVIKKTNDPTTVDKLVNQTKLSKKALTRAVKFILNQKSSQLNNKTKLLKTLVNHEQIVSALASYDRFSLDTTLVRYFDLEPHKIWQKTVNNDLTRKQIDVEQLQPPLLLIKSESLYDEDFDAKKVKRILQYFLHLNWEPAYVSFFQNCQEKLINKIADDLYQFYFETGNSSYQFLASLVDNKVLPEKKSQIEKVKKSLRYLASKDYSDTIKKLKSKETTNSL